MPRLSSEARPVDERGDTATVTIPVAVQYAMGGGVTTRGETKPWVFHTRNAHGHLMRGWQVCELDQPPVP